MTNYSKEELIKFKEEYLNLQKTLKEAGELPKKERQATEKPEWWIKHHTPILDTLKGLYTNPIFCAHLDELFDKTKEKEIVKTGKHLGLVGIQFNVSDFYTISIVNKSIKQARTAFLELQEERKEKEKELLNATPKELTAVEIEKLTLGEAEEAFKNGQITESELDKLTE